MKWNLEDLDIFRKEKAYVDTVIIPLVPIHWGEDMNGPVTAGRFVTLLAEEIERQLKGRVILSPPFTYLKKESREEKSKRLGDWVQAIEAYGAKYRICLTADLDWNPSQSEKESPGLTCFALPALPIDHMDPKHRQDYIDDHVGHVLKKMMHTWQSN